MGEHDLNATEERDVRADLAPLQEQQLTKVDSAFDYTASEDEVDPPRPSQSSPFARHLVNLPVYACYFGAAAGSRLGIRRPVDAWRRVTGVALRSEASKFALSVFGLDLWSDDPSAAATEPGGLTVERAQEHFMLRFASFLRGEPLGRLEMVHERSLSYAAPRRQVDLTLAEFGPAGELLSIRPFLDSSLATPKPREQMIRDRILPALLDSFNAQRITWDHRPPAVTDYVAPDLDGSPAAPGAARAYVKRALGATFVSFDAPWSQTVDPARFKSPAFHLRRSAGLGALNVVCRLAPNGRAVDVWVQVHHAATDGVPVQQMLDRIQRKWGIVEEYVRFPAACVFANEKAVGCSAPGAARRIGLVQEFIDFAPLLELRRKLGERSTLQTSGGVTVAALIAWCLAHQPEFAGKKFSIPCEAGGPAGGVGVLSIRPGEYFGAFNKAAAFAAFVHEFNRLIPLTRTGASLTGRALAEMALLPPRMQLYALRANAAQLSETFGTVGLSILRDAKVFIAPFGDEGFADGFLAIGDMTLPTSDGTTVGSVSIKGFAKQISTYPAALRRAIARAGEYV